MRKSNMASKTNATLRSKLVENGQYIPLRQQEWVRILVGTFGGGEDIILGVIGEDDGVQAWEVLGNVNTLLSTDNMSTSVLPYWSLVVCCFFQIQGECSSRASSQSAGPRQTTLVNCPYKNWNVYFPDDGKIKFKILTSYDSIKLRDKRGVGGRRETSECQREG